MINTKKRADDTILHKCIIDNTSFVTRVDLHSYPPYLYIFTWAIRSFFRTDSPAHLVTGCDVVHYKPAPLPVPGDAVDAVDHLVHVLNPKLCEQLGRHFVYLNQVLIITINMT